MSKKILIVDDDADVRDYLVSLLADEGYETIVATDGVEGLAVAKREAPALISLDLAMPNNTGTEFYRKLTHEKALANTPVIVVSGLAGRNLAVRKPVAVFDKPIDPAAYLAAVKQALGD